MPAMNGKRCWRWRLKRMGITSLSPRFYSKRLDGWFKTRHWAVYLVNMLIVWRLEVRGSTLETAESPSGGLMRGIGRSEDTSKSGRLARVRQREPPALTFGGVGSFSSLARGRGTLGATGH